VFQERGLATLQSLEFYADFVLTFDQKDADADVNLVEDTAVEVILDSKTKLNLVFFRRNLEIGFHFGNPVDECLLNHIGIVSGIEFSL